MARTTVSGRTPTNPEGAPVPNSDKHPDGQHVDHWVMSPEERAKGFVRPIRRSYTHVGIAGPKYELRDLNENERKHWGEIYVKFEEYPPEQAIAGRYWTQHELDIIGKGCGTVTSMPREIAETYAANPGYYGSTFCCGCGTYLPVGERGEFVWQGSTERVGT